MEDSITLLGVDRPASKRVSYSTAGLRSGGGTSSLTLLFLQRTTLTRVSVRAVYRPSLQFAPLTLPADFVQERMGGGDQSNESAIEQGKDEMISDTIRDKYKGMTGSDFPIA